MSDPGLRASAGGGRREIPWGAHDASSLSDARRLAVGRAWHHRAREEHLAVGAFALITSELAEAGCESGVLGLVARASADEVHHADVCRRYAARFLGDDAVTGRFKGVPSVPRHARATPRERALLHVVEMCCVNETFTGVYLTEMLARATDPCARAVIESLLEDEIDHGRVGWAHLASACREGWGAPVVGAALPAILERTVAPVIEHGLRAPPDDPALEAHGYLGPVAGAAVYRRAMSDVVLPGIAAAGIAPDATRALARERGWLAE